MWLLWLITLAIVIDLSLILLYILSMKKTASRRRATGKKTAPRFFTHPLGQGSLKDFFVAHAGNNHAPKSLHPHRVLFHVSVALAVKCLVFIVVFQYPMLAWMAPDIAVGEGKQIVALTNDLRAGLSLKPLAENAALNRAAAKKVEDMFINQYFAHVSPQGRGLTSFLTQGGYPEYTAAGENLAIGYSNASEVMAAWRKSPRHYENLVDPNFTQIGVALAAGTYKTEETVFSAQYFALPAGAAPAPVVAPKATIEKVVKPSDKAVLADTAGSSAPQPTKPAPTTPVVKPAPKPAPSKPAIAPVVPPATLTISQPAGKPQEKIVRVTAELPSNTASATATVMNTPIPLSAAPDGQWQGQEALRSDEAAASVAVPAALTVTDTAGVATRSDIPQADQSLTTASILDQYSLYRHHANPALAAIFNLSSIYFKLVLAAGALSLLFYLVTLKRRAHPHLLISGLGLVATMLLLILF